MDRTEAKAGPDLAWLDAILNSASDGIMAWSLTWQLTGWNAGAERILGYRAQDAIGMSVKRLWSPGIAPTLELMVAGLIRGDDVDRFDSTYRRADGGEIEVAVTMTAIRDQAGTVTGVASIVRDVSDRKRAERLLAEERTRWVTAFRGAPTGMALIGLAGEWLDVNEALCRLLQRDRDDLMQTGIAELVDPEQVRAERGDWSRVMSGEQQSYQTTVHTQVTDGASIWVEVNVSLIRDLRDAPLYFVVQVHDMTAVHKAESDLHAYADQLAELARVDPVSGLANYREFHSMLDHELQRGRRSRRPWSIVLFDIDGFAEYSQRDRLRGDRALALTGKAILSACRASDRAARIGADAFALILTDSDAAQAATAAERISGELARSGAASLSYGTATWPDDGDSTALLLVRADMSLAHHKPDRRDTAAAEVPSELESCPTDAVQEIVSVTRRFLDLDVAFLTRIEGDVQQFQTVCGDGESFCIAEGAAIDLAESYCRQMLAHRVPNVVSSVADCEALASLPITETAHMGAYVGVPVRLSNGHLFGTLCAISHDSVPRLERIDLGVLRSFANLVANHIEHDMLEATTQRHAAETTGISALLSALTARDHYTGEHSETVVDLATAVGRRLGLTETQRHEIAQVALLHDIGKVGIPDAVLQKQGPLSDAEWVVMHQHPTIGARILAGVPRFAHLAAAVNAEHERFDGAGYPDGLSGAAIPLASRITFVCDAYHAMTSDRPYRRALDAEIARDELRRGAGSQFDPEVVSALLEVLDGDESPRARIPVHDVLNAVIPRQTPAWTPSPSPTPSRLGVARAQCLRCGSFTHVTVGLASVGGTCLTCGSHELRLVQDSQPAPDAEPSEPALG